MPLPDRDLTAHVAAPPAGTGRATAGALREQALAVLLDLSLAAVVDLVCWREGDRVLVADAEGRTALAADGSHVVLAGRDPVADTDPWSDTGYPWAAARLRSLFADDRAPDLAVVHTGAHHWPERGGHLGEHGSLNGLQSRAPLLLSGAGVTARGLVDAVARTVDVGATLVHLAGGDLSGMEGRPVAAAGAGGRHVVGLLWDGAPCGEVLDLAAAGGLPSVARLLARGCALRGGSVAEFPSVTLVNHTSALTGVGPGRHGVVGNAYWDREAGVQVLPNSPDQWHRCAQWLRPGVRTVWERVEGSTACVDEPVDRGASYSTFALVRAAAAAGTGSLLAGLPEPEQDPHCSPEHLADRDYRWGSQVDAAGLEQVLGLWREGEPPRLTWWNTTLTDGGHHAGGPGSAIARAALRDADARLGVWLDLLDARGLTDDVTVLLTADHGMQGADPSCTGDWDAALTAAGVPFRDEGQGFLYLGVG